MQEQIFTFPNMTVRVHRPELTAEEREKRMKSISKAAERLLREGRHEGERTV